MPELVGYSHRTFPLFASNARNFRSLVPPENTRPPPVVRIGPQFGEVGKGCVQTLLPVSTFHACTSPMWSAFSAIRSVVVAPTNDVPAEYAISRPTIVAQRFSLAGM